MNRYVKRIVSRSGTELNMLLSSSGMYYKLEYSDGTVFTHYSTRGTENIPPAFGIYDNGDKSLIVPFCESDFRFCIGISFSKTCGMSFPPASLFTPNVISFKGCENGIVFSERLEKWLSLMDFILNIENIALHAKQNLYLPVFEHERWYFPDCCGNDICMSSESGWGYLAKRLMMR